MRRRSRELIADLVAGRSEDPTEAMETIVRSPRMLAAYNEQVAAREALTGVGPASMTESERTDLHRDVWTGVTTAAPESAVAPGAIGWRAIGAAAAVVVVVGGTALLMQPMSGEAGEEAMLTADATTAGEEAPAAGRDGIHEGEVEGAPLGPQTVETEDLLRRYAEIVRTDIQPAFALSESDALCSDIDELEGMRPAARFDINGVEYQAWVPADVDPDEVDDDTPITFIDVVNCTVQPPLR